MDSPRVLLERKKRRKKIAVAVSQEPHCLDQIIGVHAGKMHGEIVSCWGILFR